MRNEHPIFRRPKFFQGRSIRGQEIKDIMWFNSYGEAMTEEEWSNPGLRCVGMLLSGDAIDVRTFKNEPILDETYLLLFNAHHEAECFVVPGREKVRWQKVLDTADEDGFLAEPKEYASGDENELEARSMAMFRLVSGGEGEARTASWRKSVRTPAAAPRPAPEKEVEESTAAAEPTDS